LDLNDDSAFALGVLLNMALALRKAGKSQSEVSELLKIPRRTISYWEAEEKGNISLGGTAITYIPDLRILVPKSEYERIYERAKASRRRSRGGAEPTTGPPSPAPKRGR
jgi:hypothetical protein